MGSTKGNSTARDLKSVAQDPSTRERPGQPCLRIPGYNLFDVVGEGGAGVVYRAQRTNDGQVTAIKVLRREFCFDSLMLNRFEREIQAISLLKHPNIVRVLDVGQTEDERPYYSMEFLRGETLKTRLQRPPRLSLHEAVSFFSEVGYAMSYAHDQGIVHRDLKSSNIIVLDEPDAASHVKLVDFGVAKFLEPLRGHRGITRQGAMLGSTSAMCPEQIRGQPIDRRADIYALGILLFELLTGELPFVAQDTGDLLHMHLERPAPLPSQRHRPVYAFDAIVMRALQKRREDRFDNARDMVDACQLALQRPGLRPRAPTRRAPALGLCVRLDARPNTLTEPDVLRSIVDIKHKVAQHMEEHGFIQTISTMHAQLGILLLPQDSTQKIAKLSASEQFLETLSNEVHGLEPTGVQVRMTLHVDEAEISSQDDRFIAGPILRYEDWSMTSVESSRRTRLTPMFERSKDQSELAL